MKVRDEEVEALPHVLTSFPHSLGVHVALELPVWKQWQKFKCLFYPSCTQSLSYICKAMTKELNPSYIQWYQKKQAACVSFFYLSIFLTSFCLSFPKANTLYSEQQKQPDVICMKCQIKEGDKLLIGWNCLLIFMGSQMPFVIAEQSQLNDTCRMYRVQHDVMPVQLLHVWQKNCNGLLPKC